MGKKILIGAVLVLGWPALCILALSGLHLDYRVSLAVAYGPAVLVTAWLLARLAWRSFGEASFWTFSLPWAVRRNGWQRREQVVPGWDGQIGETTNRMVSGTYRRREFQLVDSSTVTDRRDEEDGGYHSSMSCTVSVAAQGVLPLANVALDRITRQVRFGGEPSVCQALDEAGFVGWLRDNWPRGVDGFSMDGRWLTVAFPEQTTEGFYRRLDFLCEVAHRLPARALS